MNLPLVVVSSYAAKYFQQVRIYYNITSAQEHACLSNLTFTPDMTTRGQIGEIKIVRVVECFIPNLYEDSRTYIVITRDDGNNTIIKRTPFSSANPTSQACPTTTTTKEARRMSSSEYSTTQCSKLDRKIRGNSESHLTFSRFLQIVGISLICQLVIRERKSRDSSVILTKKLALSCHHELSLGRSSMQVMETKKSRLFSPQPFDFKPTRLLRDSPKVNSKTEKFLNSNVTKNLYGRS